MQPKHRIITITGGDCAGKETQTKLLQKVLVPSERLSAPDYNHWAGKIIQSILQEKSFGLWSGKLDDHDVNVYQQGKHPQILQLLHNINTWDKQETIKEKLKTRHLVMDRYIEDAYAYGVMDGCSLDFLLDLNRNFIQSDVVILLLGKGYPRSGETQDINERDSMFQQNVRRTYDALMSFFPHWRAVDIESHQVGSVYESIHRIHKGVCDWVSRGIKEVVEPLSIDEVKEYVNEWESQRLQSLKQTTET